LKYKEDAEQTEGNQRNQNNQRKSAVKGIRKSTNQNSEEPIKIRDVF